MLLLNGVDLMNGILLINKKPGITSRDVVNEAIKKLSTKKIGHTGTLDPLATGVMVLCVGSATKLVDLLTSDDKEYIAEVTLGIQTDTLDITGNIIKKEDVILTRNDVYTVLESFLGSYNQEVPIYSAVKIHGKKLYEYARNNEKVELPKREVIIKSIELLNFISTEKEIKFSFKCLVSKGTYIRSLIRDICKKLKVIGTMSNLVRTKQGKFKLEDCLDIEKITSNNIIKIEDLLDIPKIYVDDKLKKKILNGQILDNIYNQDMIMFFDENRRLLAIYQIYNKDISKIKPYVMLYNKQEDVI